MVEMYVATPTINYISYTYKIKTKRTEISIYQFRFNF